jgi:hypothetical protein
MFRALIAHPQEALHRRHLVYCVHVMSVGCTRIEASGNACYHSVQNVFSSSLLSKNVKIQIYRTIILPVVL